MRYKVVGCIQGYGMDADKFYDDVRIYEADSHGEASSKAEADGMFVEHVKELDEDEA